MFQFDTKTKDKLIAFLIALAIALGSTPSGSAQQQSIESQQAIQMIRGLKERRLFDLADQYANSQINSEQIPRNEKVSVLNELIRAKVVQAASLTGEARAQTWDRAHELIADFMRNDPKHPQKLLLQVQDALTHYSHGNLISQEVAAEIQTIDQKAQAIDQFRKANKLFTTIDKEIENEIPIARSRTATDGELTEEQLINLKNNIRYQLARINLARAEMYEPNDKLNRIDALQQVLSRLDELIRQTNSDVPLWWRAQTSRIECLRLMNRIDQAIGVIKNLPDNELTDELKSDLLTEQILIAAEKGVSSDKLLEQVMDLPRPDPQLSLAVLKWLMVSAAKANANAKQKLQQQADNWVTQIETQHGAYWGRRAEILLVGSIKPAATSSKNLAQGDFQILVRQADNAFRKGNYPDAARAYEKATDFAQQGNRAKEAVYLTVRQAQCYENLKDHPRAADRLIEIANRYPDQANAAAIHLRGCWNYAKTANDLESKSQFTEHLKRQADRWPSAEPSNQARIWLGDHYQNEKQWKQAVEAYLSVQPVSSKSLTAAEQIAATTRRWYSNVQIADRKLVAQQVDKLIDDKLQFSSGRRDTWTEAERLLLLDWLDASLRQGSLSSPDGLALIDSAVREVGDTQVEWRKNAQVRRIALQMSNGQSSVELENAIRRLPADNRLLKELMLLVDETTTEQQQEQFAQLAIMICDKALASANSERDLSFWQIRKAKSAIVVGQVDQVVSDLETLASENPKSLEVQLAYGRVLSEMPDRNEAAIKQWRKLATKVKKGTDAWYECKFNVVKLMIRDGKSEDAIKLVEYLEATSPDWSKSVWAEEFEQLLRK